MKVVDSKPNHTVVTVAEIEKMRGLSQTVRPITSLAHASSVHLGQDHTSIVAQPQQPIVAPIVMQQTRQSIPLPSQPDPSIYKGIIHKKTINITKQFM